MSTHVPFRYEQLADLIVGMIDNGTLAPGTRLLSVRAVSEQRNISIFTALQAYRLLADRGILVVRPQSGYYVAGMRRGALALPSTSRPRARIDCVDFQSRRGTARTRIELDARAARLRRARRGAAAIEATRPRARTCRTPARHTL